MNAETSKRISTKTRRLLNLRLNNQLRYVRVELTDNENIRSDALFEIMDIFTPDVIQGDNSIRFFVEGDRVEHINEISSIPGVEKVEIF